MTRALRCFGYVLLGIGGVTAAAVVLFGTVGLLIWLSVVTADWFGLPVKDGLLFMIGYCVLGAGCVVGVSLCKDNS